MSLSNPVAAIHLGLQDKLFLGNLDAKRDWGYAPDYTEAMWLMLQQDEPEDFVIAALTAEIGSGVFNVCRGSATSVAELVEMVSARSGVPVRHEVDPALLRAHDTRILYGSRDRLTEACGWKPEIPLEQTIEDTLAWWRERLGA